MGRTRRIYTGNGDNQRRSEPKASFSSVKQVEFRMLSAKTPKRKVETDAFSQEVTEVIESDSFLPYLCSLL